MYVDWGEGPDQIPNAIAVANPDGTKIGSTPPTGTGDVNLLEIGGAAVAIGQAAMAASLPVALASDQSAISSKMQDGAGTDLDSSLHGTTQALSVEIVDAAGAQITVFGTPAAALETTQLLNKALLTTIDADTGTLAGAVAAGLMKTDAYIGGTLWSRVGAPSSGPPVGIVNAGGTNIADVNASGFLKVRDDDGFTLLTTVGVNVVDIENHLGAIASTVRAHDLSWISATLQVGARFTATPVAVGDGDVTALLADAEGRLEVNIASGAGDATAANQTTGNASLASILADTTAILAKIVAAPALDATIVTGNAILTTIDTDTGVIAEDTTSLDAKTPSLGQSNKAGSVPVTLASDEDTVNVDVTANTIGLATSAKQDIANGSDPPAVSDAAWVSDVYDKDSGGGAPSNVDIGAGAPTGRWHIVDLHASVDAATVLTLTEETSGTIIEKWRFGINGGTRIGRDPRWADRMPTVAKKLLVTSSNDVGISIKYRMYDA
jgi:hypothetical protein